ncbi:hypothetical protein BV25DRAFT_1829340 [Artomyces pyxidatus]|uniref:Uncharacterized protein n=1 Tax=Artomyces pyxidatus TaxID=48021 RepID=A0ACB8SSG4_9AGAM|nr:hypothetical protein BV25DRAFT_1829340 [Artomyces pyxidatus]
MTKSATSRPQKRARVKSLPSSSPALQDASTTPNERLRLPTELLYDIIATSLGDFVSDLILSPVAAEWDAISSFLHVSRSFRGCTIRLLYHLWGDTFIHEQTRVLSNYKPTLSIFIRLSKLARDSPGEFLRERKPKLLSERVIRHPLSPLARLWSCLIRNTANANALLADCDGCQPESVFSLPDFEAMKASYDGLPEGVRHLLLGRVMRHIILRAATWFKLNALAVSVNNIFRMIFMMAFSDIPWQAFRFEISGPMNSDADVSVQSRILHEKIAALFSITADDLPSLTLGEIQAIGLDEAMVLLSVIEAEHDGRATFCRYLKGFLAAHLTDHERARHMWARTVTLFPLEAPPVEEDGIEDDDAEASDVDED